MAHSEPTQAHSVNDRTRKACLLGVGPIDVLLMQEDGRITLKVTDNGIGFKPFTYKSGSHQGLASIGEQVSLLDGTMNIQPATGGGTAVVISMPMNGGDSYENFVGR